MQRLKSWICVIGDFQAAVEVRVGIDLWLGGPQCGTSRASLSCFLGLLLMSQWTQRCLTVKGSVEVRLPSSPDHSQHPRHQLLLYSGVSRWSVLHLQDDFMGLSEEVLPYCSFHSPVPCSQLGSAFKNLAASPHRL